MVLDDDGVEQGSGRMVEWEGRVLVDGWMVPENGVRDACKGKRKFAYIDRVHDTFVGTMIT